MGEANDSETVTDEYLYAADDGASHLKSNIGYLPNVIIFHYSLSSINRRTHLDVMNINIFVFETGMSEVGSQLMHLICFVSTERRLINRKILLGPAMRGRKK